MSDSPTSTVLVTALRKVLAPVARLMLAKGMTLPMAIELLKRVFVEVAEHDFQLEEKSLTDSRISLLTGVHRKDVRRLRDLPQGDSDLPPKISLGAQVVAKWITNPTWLDANGDPLPLPRSSRRGGELSFESLFASINRDIRPRSVLDEWLRLGVVSLSDKDEVILNQSAFIPQHDADDKLAYFALNVGDHAAAATDNVLGAREPWFERSVHHDGLTEQQIALLRERASNVGMTILRELHKSAEKLDGENAPQNAAPPGEANQRFTCGIYFYSTTDSGKD
jgi:hypothetical protein